MLVEQQRARIEAVGSSGSAGWSVVASLVRSASL
jgi:hypothetical protein